MTRHLPPFLLAALALIAQNTAPSAQPASAPAAAASSQSSGSAAAASGGGAPQALSLDPQQVQDQETMTSPDVDALWATDKGADIKKNYDIVLRICWRVQLTDALAILTITATSESDPSKKGVATSQMKAR